LIQLAEMQHYASTEQTPAMKTMEQRWNAVTSRADVQTALAKVGRVERFDLVAPAF